MRAIPRTAALNQGYTRLVNNATLTPGSKRFHAVKFYEDSESLCRLIADFLGEGFVGLQPAIVIARPTHLAQIEAELYARGFDVSRLKSTGDLLVVDAERILEQFIIDGMPDRARFETVVIPLIEQSVLDRDKCVIRAYGEMVDVLWQSGQMTAAIKLEMLWNELAQTHDFSLLCGYAMGNFYKDAVIGDICQHHTHVLSDMQDIAPVQ